ncbi:hypothetical protein [Streptomyces sp. NPDC056468]|uniref:hypothetical protein n=1 Tax=Streptomyces sp. NPDC056468 TaxID=3345830 RepID=UPI003686E606
MFPGEAERFPAGRQHSQIGGSLKEAAHQCAATAQEVLAGIQGKQNVLVLEPPGEGVQRIHNGVVGESESVRHAGYQQLVILERPEIDPDHSSAAVQPHAVRPVEGETALAYATHAGEGDETLYCQAFGYVGQFTHTAHETARNVGEVDHHTVSVPGLR